jgi:hypothetical protein
LDYLVPLPVYCLQLVITFTLILYTCVDEVHDIVLSKIKSVNLYQCCNVVDVCPHHNDQDKLMVEWLMLALYMVRVQPTEPVEPARIKPILHAPYGLV